MNYVERITKMQELIDAQKELIATQGIVIDELERQCQLYKETVAILKTSNTVLKAKIELDNIKAVNNEKTQETV